MSDAHHEQMRRLWVSMMLRVENARKRGVGVRLTPDEVEMMYLSFDGYHPDPVPTGGMK